MRRAASALQQKMYTEMHRNTRCVDDRKCERACTCTDCCCGNSRNGNEGLHLPVQKGRRTERSMIALMCVLQKCTDQNCMDPPRNDRIKRQENLYRTCTKQTSREPVRLCNCARAFLVVIEKISSRGSFIAYIFNSGLHASEDVRIGNMQALQACERVQKAHAKACRKVGGNSFRFDSTHC